MRASREMERDDFDRLICWALAAKTQNAHPSKNVWQRIIHRIVNSDEIKQVARRDVARQDRSVGKFFVSSSYVGSEQHRIILYAGLVFTYGI